MADLLIKDMEMPKNCGSCRIVQRYRYSDECQYLSKTIARNGRLKGCPLVEVKPHGRLVDADELVGNISDTYCEECSKTKPIMCKSCEYEDIMDDIENAPTVLEAST